MAGGDQEEQATIFAVEGDEPTAATEFGSGRFRARSEVYAQPGDRRVLNTRPAIEMRNGRYRDMGLIAVGGMGEVRRVYDRLMGCVLAMKILSVKLIDSARDYERFLHEARMTARLRHPGIVSAQDMGTLSDGRPWFTMEEVRGRTLTKAIAELHGASDGEHAGPPLRLRRLVEAMLRVCEAMNYAHARGVIHRDLKPDNLMLGRFGEVLVMDWGLALHLSEHETQLDSTISAHDAASRHGGVHTAARDDETAVPAATGWSIFVDSENEIIGTLRYMAPEQACGESLTPACDVYALGAVLYEMMTGRAPYSGSRAEIYKRLLAATPAPVPADEHWLRPAELVAICQRAMQRDIADRYADAGMLAEALRAFLDDRMRRERALERVAAADAAWPVINKKLGQAAAHRRQAAELLDGVREIDPVSRKEPAWALQDKAEQLLREASVDEVSYQQLLRSALEESPQLPEAHERLADYYHRRLQQAEAARNPTDASSAEALLRIHNRGRYDDYLSGQGTLSVQTDPPGVEVFGYRYEEHKRALVPEPMGRLGVTPITALSLPRGSYLLRLSSPGYESVHYPVAIERDQHWDGVRPGSAEPHPIGLLKAGALNDGDVYVPAGWVWTGGDTLAIQPFPRRRVWVDGFVIRRDPVVYREYLLFLNALLDETADVEAVRAWAPRPALGGNLDWDKMRVLSFDEPSQRFRMNRPEQHNHPVTLIDWHAASRYARWCAERSGLSWGLPNELQWEKAARGVDGRFLPWGDFFETTRACVANSHTGPPGVMPVSSFPEDVSPYGVRGMTGNVRDWCREKWTRGGPPVIDERVVQPPIAGADDEGLRSSRGGAWMAAATTCRLTSRFAGKPSQRYRAQGMRLVRPLAPHELAAR